jgi:hypothetical protein
MSVEEGGVQSLVRLFESYTYRWKQTGRLDVIPAPLAVCYAQILFLLSLHMHIVLTRQVVLRLYNELEHPLTRMNWRMQFASTMGIWYKHEDGKCVSNNAHIQWRINRVSS